MTKNPAVAAILSATDIWDMTLPWLPCYWDLEILARYRHAGYTFVSATLQDWPPTFDGTRRCIERFQALAEPAAAWLTFGSTLEEIDRGRQDGKLVVGATCVESDDRSPVSVRGALELLTSAYSVLPALAEARILEFNAQVRPALPDNLPALHFDQGRNVLYINGLYRHGFLLTPTVVEEVLAILSVQKSSAPVGRWSCLRPNLPITLLAAVRDEVATCLS